MYLSRMISVRRSCIHNIYKPNALSVCFHVISITSYMYINCAYHAYTNERRFIRNQRNRSFDDRGRNYVLNIYGAHGDIMY